MKPNQPSSARNALSSEYAGLAESYDARWSSYVEKTVGRTIERMHLQPEERVLDVGCGTGVLLHRLCATHPAARLVGVDPVPAMLGVARGRLPSDVALVTGWAEQLPLAPGRFDVLVCCSVLHYVHDPAAALREMRRLLRPGGRLVITDWCSDYFSSRLMDRYLRVAHRAHVKTYSATEFAGMLRKAGFTVQDISRYKISWLWGLMTATAITDEA